MLDPADAPLPLEDPATPSAPVAGRPDGHRRTDPTDDSAHGASAGPAEIGTMRSRRTFSLDTRPDWMNEVRREDARSVRYGRPASVVLIELTREASGSLLDAIARDVRDVIRGEARSTDRAVRVTAGSFRILMPETGELAARIAAARLERTYRTTASGRAGHVLRMDVAACSGSRSLIEALEDAEERLGIVDPRRMTSSA